MSLGIGEAAHLTFQNLKEDAENKVLAFHILGGLGGAAAVSTFLGGLAETTPFLAIIYFVITVVSAIFCWDAFQMAHVYQNFLDDVNDRLASTGLDSFFKTFSAGAQVLTVDKDARNSTILLGKVLDAINECEKDL